MTKKKEQLKKFRELDKKNITNKIVELKKQIILLKIKLVTKQPIKVHHLKENKKQVAQLFTLQNNKN
uniref:Ribosomal protein L29 n=1 Tax=Halydictyon mirabile TaxID=189652 RepID=A0A4D6WZF0_9FLOR|nr:ribosomal protein L29 [Halydictyon mirabile]